MKFTLPIDITNMDAGDQDLVRAIAVTFQSLTSIINGRIGLTDNLQTHFVTVTFNKANVQQAVIHELGKIPTGYIQVGSKAAAQVYDGTQANTIGTIYLQSSVVTTVRLLIF